MQAKTIKCMYCGLKKHTLPLSMESLAFDGTNLYGADFNNVAYKSEDQGKTFTRMSLLSEDEVKTLLHFTLTSKCCQNPYYLFEEILTVQMREGKREGDNKTEKPKMRLPSGNPNVYWR